MLMDIHLHEQASMLAMEIAVFEAKRGKFDKDVEVFENGEGLVHKGDILRLKGEFSQAKDAYVECLANLDTRFQK